MNGEKPPFETLDLVSAEPIEVHEEAGAISRLTLLLETLEAKKITLTIETQAAHDLAVLVDSAEQQGASDLDKDGEPVLIVPGKTLNADFVQNVLSWPLSVLERFLVPQTDDTKDLHQKNIQQPDPEAKRYINNAIWPLRAEE